MSKVKWDKLAELIQDIEKLPKSFAGPNTRKAIKDSIEPLLAEIKASAPVDTGASRDAIDIEWGKSRSPKTSVNIVAKTPEGDKGFILHFAEYGTVDQPAKPFLRPAFDKHAEDCADNALNSLADLVEKELRK